MMILDMNLREQLIDQTQKLTQERGWTWREPVEITSGFAQGEPVWIIRTNVLMLSPSVRVIFRQSDLSVMHVGYLPR